MILTLVHTQKRNAYLIALTLPLFSLIISAHPAVIKTVLIAGELSLNVWLFFELKKIFSHTFVAAFLSIIISKLIYYAAKALLISGSLLQGELISTPLYLQFVMTIIFSFYVYMVLRKSEH